jgi:hypothetical protein
VREPTKALYETLDANPDQEFDHFLCLKLGWQSLERMRREMSAAEWNSWRLYYLRRGQERELARAQAGGG